MGIKYTVQLIISVSLRNFLLVSFDVNGRFSSALCCVTKRFVTTLTAEGVEIRYRQQAANQAGVSRKSGLVSRIRAHLGRETRRRKAQYYRLLRERGGLLPTMRERLELTDGEMAFLYDLERYGCGLLDTRPHLSLVFLAWRHRKILFPAASSLQRLFFVTSSLFKYISIRPGDQNASQ